MRRLRWLLPFIAVLAVIWAVILVPHSAAHIPRCSNTAHAAYGATPSEWCYTVPITITYSGTSTVTNQAVRVMFPVAGWINSKLADTGLWDLRPYVGSFNVQTDVMAQGTASSSAPFWFSVPSIDSTAGRTVNLLLGLADNQRDQGILLTGTDELSAVHHADYNIADALSLTVEAEVIGIGSPVAAKIQEGTLAAHWSGNGGYRLQLVNAAGTLKIRGTVDNQTCDVTWSSTWTDTNRNIGLTFNNPNLAVLIDGVAQNTCNTGLASISATSTPFVIGTSLSDVIVRDVRLLSGTAVKAHWGFDPPQMTEATSTNPFAGTVTDMSGNGHTTTYTFTRPQTAWTASLGSISLVSSGAVLALPTSIPNVFGSQILGNTDLTTDKAQTTGDFFATLYRPAVTSFTGPVNLIWAALLGGFGLGLAILAYSAFRYVPLALFVAGIPYLYGVLRGYLPAWFLLVWALFVVMGWFAVRQGESA